VARPAALGRVAGECLFMDGHSRRNSAIPRRDAPEALINLPPQERAWGMPGAQCTRSLVCEVVVQDAHEYSQRSHRKSPGIPARNGFNGFLRALPGDRAFLSPSSLRSLLLKNLTPASRRQDHTTSPSASKTLSSLAPPASIASNPASVTIAIRPLSGVDGGGYKVICDFGKPEYFFGGDWTGRNRLIRLSKLDFTRKSAGARGGQQPFFSTVTPRQWHATQTVCRTAAELRPRWQSV
jgi:hypothetical protein